MATQPETPADETAQPATNESTRPTAKFSGSGGISAAIWKQKSENGPDHYSIRVDRTFRDSSGNFESTPYLREGDVLRVQKILGQVDDWIEQDRAKTRSGQGPERAGGRQ